MPLCSEERMFSELDCRNILDIVQVGVGRENVHVFRQLVDSRFRGYEAVTVIHVDGVVLEPFHVGFRKPIEESPSRQK